MMHFIKGSHDNQADKQNNVAFFSHVLMDPVQVLVDPGVDPGLVAGTLYPKAGNTQDAPDRLHSIE